MQHSQFRNAILSSLPEQEIGALLPHLVPVDLKLNLVLHNPGEPVDTVYFLEDGVCSVVLTMEDGNSVEAGIIGREGFVGIPAILGTGSSINRTVIQLAGSGYSVPARLLSEMAARTTELPKRLMRSIQGLLAQTAQTGACNRIHRIEERLSRWLLMCVDRMRNETLSITHEYLAIMLGTRRSTVTLALGILQTAGMIENARGRVRVVNRKGLEGTACECYAAVNQEYLRLGLL